jgi:hypothetical protein
VALSSLALTAMRRHDTRAVRALLPRAFEASKAAGAKFHGHIVADMAVAAWLAWQDGRADEVLRLAAEIESPDLRNVGSSAMQRWAYLFPVLAVRLAAGATGAAVAAARQIIDPSQQSLPDDLTAALTAASRSWDQASAAETTGHLTNALALARAHGYF